MPKITDNSGKPFAEIGTLLRNLRLRRGMSQFDVAKAVGINNSYLSRIENGERRPSPKILTKFADILDYPYDELVVKSGILSEEFVRSAQSASQPPAADSTTKALQDLLHNLQQQPQVASGMAPSGVKRGVPVFDTVPAGLLKEANVVEAYDDIEKLVLSEDELGFDPQAFALIVSGDSMIEAGILDGDVVIVSPNTKVSDGDIAVVQVNRRTTTVKKVYIEGSRIILQPANFHFKPQVLNYPDEVEILGKVILVRRKIL